MNHTDHKSNTVDIPLNRLYLLESLDDYKVQDGDSDIRGWNFYAGEHRIGEVKNLIFNPRFQKVLYVGIELDESVDEYRTADSNAYIDNEYRSYYGTHEDRYIIVPIGMISIDEEEQIVRASHNLDSTHFANSPRFSYIDNGTIAPIHELLVVRYYTDYDDLYTSDYNEDRFDINAFRNEAYITDEGFYTSDLFNRRRYFDRYRNYNPSMSEFKTGMIRRR